MAQLGKYELHEQIGKGGFGTVYRATDTSLGRPVALKILRPQMVADTAFVERFRKEACLSAQLKNPHVVTIHEVGEQAGRYFIAMSYYPGGSLADSLRNDPLPWEQCVSILAQVCEGLHQLHKRGWVHRDMKPSNILFDEQGRAVVADFGLACALTTSSLSSGGIAVALHYKAPELWRGTPPVSSATDVYSLGCILGEMLTGQTLFPGETPDEVMTKYMLDGPEFGENWPPAGVPEGVKNFIRHCVSKNLDDRPVDAAAFYWELQDIKPKVVAPLKDGTLVQPPTTQPMEPLINPPPTQPVLSDVPDDMPPSYKEQRIIMQPHLFDWLWVALSIVGAGVLIMLAWIIFGNSMEERNAQALIATQTTVALMQPTKTVAPTRAPTNTARPTKVPAATNPPADITRPTNCTQNGQTLVSSVDGMTQVCVPAGEFIMGSDKSKDADAYEDELPQRTVYLDAYWIDQTEVTNVMYEKFIQDSGYTTTAEEEGWAYVFENNEGWQPVEGANWRYPFGSDNTWESRKSHPVIQLSWYDAQAYCKWAGRRLPTEAEWEKAARGIDGRIYPWGNNPPTGSLANFADSNTNFDWSAKSIDDGYANTSPVGIYPKGASYYGTLDMAGNVWEWVADWFDAEYYGNSPVANPTGSRTGEYRVLRGGSWSNEPFYLRAADRLRGDPINRFNLVGFRCSR